jgi:hypothetical protein
MGLTKPVRKLDISIKDLGGETLLFNTDEEAIHILNPTAQLIWKFCDGTHTVTDIEQAIRTNFSVPDGQDVAADIQRTLAVFTDKGLLQELE